MGAEGDSASSLKKNPQRALKCTENRSNSEGLCSKFFMPRRTLEGNNSLLASAYSPDGGRALSSQHLWSEPVPVFLLHCLHAAAVLVSQVMSQRGNTGQSMGDTG